MRTYAQLTTSVVVFCNRVGVDESISFWGGSEVIAAERRHAASARRSSRRGCSSSRSPLADLRRERLALPLLRDERPELQVRELSRIVAERAGLAWDSTADDGAEPGLDVAPGEPVHEPIGFREDPTCRLKAGREPMTDASTASRRAAVRAARPSSRSTPTSPAG